MALLAIFARKYPYFSTGKFKKTAFGNSPTIFFCDGIGKVGIS